MKVMVYEGAKKISVMEVHDLPLASNQMRIQTMFTGISHGTEMSVYRGTAPFFQRKKDGDTSLFVPANENEVWSYPIKSCDPGVWYMGYANVGTVIETGSEITDIKVGDVVYSNAPHQTQIIKYECEVVKLPDTIKPEYGIFFTNLMTAYNGILDTKIKLGDTIVVSGLGVLGQLVAQMAKLSGAFKVYAVEMFDMRIAAALENGVDIALSPIKCKDVALEIRKLTDNKGPDSVIEISGNVKALNEAVRIAAPDTTITALGWYQNFCSDLTLSEEFHHNRIAIRCSQSTNINPEIRHMWDYKRKEKACIELLGMLKLGNLITNTVPYDDIADAFKLVDSIPGEIIQVMLKY